MNELQSGLLDDVTEINTNVLRAWKLLQKNEKNQFSLISEDLMTKVGANSEEKFQLFTQNAEKINYTVEKMQEWVKSRPRKIKPESEREPKPPSNPKPKPKLREEAAVKEKPSMLKERNKENVPVNPGKKRADYVDSDELMRGNSPQKKLKSNVVSRVNNESTRTSKGVTPVGSVVKREALGTYEMNNGAGLKKKTEEVKVVDQPKELKFEVVSRFKLDGKNYECFRYLDVHAITFKANREVMLVGFGHYTIFNPQVIGVFEYTLMEGDSVDQADEMNATPKVVFLNTFTLTKDSNSSKIMPVTFDKPIKILKNKFFTLKVLNKTKNVVFHCFKGINGIEKCFPFTFQPSRFNDANDIHTGTRRGQIPEFIYMS